MPPLYHYTCRGCGKPRDRILRPECVNSPGECTFCGGELERQATGPSQQVIERVDNGIMPRAVERYSESERIYRERREAQKKGE